MSRISTVLAVLLACGLSPASAREWPMHRGDAARSGYTEESLPGKLALKWTHYPRHRPAPAWPRDERIEFDRAYHVAVAQGCVYFGSSADGQVVALDAATGAERWSFCTESPVRFAPVSGGSVSSRSAMTAICTA